MARGKKVTKELTAEEKLKQALVPVDEQPYPVPENWCWTYIGNGFNVTSSKRVHKKDWVNAGIPFYRTRELVKLSEYGHIDNELFISKELYEKLVGDFGRPQIGDILISGVGTIGVPFIIKDNALFYFKDGNVIWFQNKGICLPEFVFYLYKSSFMLNQIHDMSAGTTVDTYTIVNATKTIFPLPPFAEQQRIVNRIESIFAKLDEAKEKARAVVDGFELRKSAILHKAFTGELTEKWRQEHGVGMDSWTTKLLKDVACLQTGLMKGKHYTGKTRFLPYLRVANVQDGYLDLEEIKEIEVSETLIQRYLLKQGDVLFTEGGDFDKLGRGAVWENQIDNCLHQNHVFVVRPNENILNPYFLSIQAGSRYGKKYFLSCSKQTTNLASINSTQLKNFPVMIPCMEEQIKIVHLIKGLLKKEQQAKEVAESVLDQIDTMKKAVLARAFRGELGTNDPTEESAVELLEYVLCKK